MEEAGAVEGEEVEVAVVVEGEEVDWFAVAAIFGEVGCRDFLGFDGVRLMDGFIAIVMLGLITWLGGGAS